jgi:hypothetical protein
MIAGLRLLEVVLPMLSLTQPPDSAWAHAYGGEKEEWAVSVTARQESGYAVTGHTVSFGSGGRDVWLLATDDNGDSLWSKTYGDTHDDIPEHILQTAAGAFLISGSTHLPGFAGTDMLLIRTDANGNLLWQRSYGGPRSDVARCSVALPHGGYAVCGYAESAESGSDGFLMAVDEQGDSLWSRSFGGSESDKFWDMTILNDEILLVGTTESFHRGADDGWIVKTNLRGDSLWAIIVGGEKDDRLRAIFANPDGSYYAAGLTDEGGSGSSDYWLIKFSAANEILWSRVFGGRGQEMCVAAAPSTDGGAVLCGHSFSFGAGRTDVWLMKVSSSGDSLWSRTFGGASYEDAYCILPTKDFGYVLAGYTRSFASGEADFWLVKTEPDTAEIILKAFEDTPAETSSTD